MESERPSHVKRAVEASIGAFTDYSGVNGVRCERCYGNMSVESIPGA